MRFSVQVSHYRPRGGAEPAIELAEQAEELGFDAVWVADRVVDPARVEAVYPNGGPNVVRSEGIRGGVADSIVLLSMIGSRTSRIRLGLSVLVVPYRPALISAKQIATLDALTGGRVIAGAGAGWHVQEFEGLGIPFEERGRRTDEAIRVWKSVWSGNIVEFSGEFTNFGPLAVLPQPAQRGGPPIWIGGHSGPARRRTGMLGDAWFPTSVTPNRYRSGIDEIRRIALLQGRQPPVGGFVRRIVFAERPEHDRDLFDPYATLVATPDEVIDVIRTYEESGVEHLKIDIDRGSLDANDVTVFNEALCRGDHAGVREGPMNTPSPVRSEGRLPEGLLEAAGKILGSPVASYTLMYGGFSGQANGSLLLENGERAVMKTSVEGDMMAMSGIPWTSIIERESWMYRNLEGVDAYRPSYLGDVRADGWIGLLIEHIGDADRVPPWTEEAIDGTARALAELHRLPRLADMPPDVMRRTFPQPYLERILGRDHYPGRLPPAYCTGAWWNWFEAAAPAISEAFDGFFGPLPYAFCHNDVRSDNMFFRRGKPIFLDWNQAVWSTPARDSVYWAVGVEREGGGKAPEIFQRYLDAGGTDPTDAGIKGVLAWWFLHSIDCLQNDELRLPALLLRMDQMPTVLRWLVKIIDIPRPPVAL